MLFIKGTKRKLSPKEYHCLVLTELRTETTPRSPVNWHYPSYITKSRSQQVRWTTGSPSLVYKRDVWEISFDHETGILTKIIKLQHTDLVCLCLGL